VGGPEALDAALACGADAVYLGLRSFSARARATNFAYSQFEAALHSAHRMGRKLYVTVNTVFEQREADRVYQLLKYLAAVGADAVLVQDYGVMEMMRSCFPGLKIHASTQMAIASSRGCNFLSKKGVSRVVLARELGLEEIKQLRSRTNIELEIFVHGALCVSVSGLCLFSSYLGGKSANRGMCTQACRRIYYPEGRSAETDDGLYAFSSFDYQLLEAIPGLAAAGVDSFKIEGRMKSAEYVGTVTSAYRKVLDSIGAGEDAQAQALKEAQSLLRQDFARKKTRHLFDGLDNSKEGLQRWLDPLSSGATGFALGKVLDVRAGGGSEAATLDTGMQALIDTEGEDLKTGDTLRFHKADDSARVSIKVHHLETENGQPTDTRVWAPLPQGFGQGDSVYLVQTRAARRYPSVIPRDLSPFRHTPGRESAPDPLHNFKAVQKSPAQKGRPLSLEPGVYVQADKVETLYLVQSEKPPKVILEYNASTARALKAKQALPFGRNDIIIALNPFFPQADEDALSGDIDKLLGLGFKYFMLNNPGHLSLFRDKAARTLFMAGPWLYTFNRWSQRFILDSFSKITPNQDAVYTVCPLENNRQNLERTLDLSQRSNCFVTLFAYPALFRMRPNLHAACGFKRFTDKQGQEFSLECGFDGLQGGSLVRPLDPFSIVDKKPFLEKAGFKRFILNLSGSGFKKKDYKDLLDAMQRGQPLEGISRFNWKDGFYQEQPISSPSNGKK
jgi:putative protease